MKQTTIEKYSPPFALAILSLLWIDLFVMLSTEWRINEQYSFGYFVPFIGFYLFWLRWQDRPAKLESQSARKPISWGIYATIVVCAILFYPVRIVFEANPDWRLLYWTHASLILVITLAVLGLWGSKKWSMHFFPALFMFLFAVPWPSGIEQPLVQNLMRLVSIVTVEAVNLCGVPAIRAGNLIHLTDMPIGVEEACSGVRSLQSNIMAGWFFGELYRYRASGRVLLLLLAVPLSIVLNLIRTLFLVYAAQTGGAERLEAWHDPVGNIAALGGFVLLFVLATILKNKKESTDEEAAVSTQRSSIFPARATLIFAMIGLFTAASSHLAAEWWYQSHEEKSSAGRLFTRVEKSALPASAKEVEIDPLTRAMLRYTKGQQLVWQSSRGIRHTLFHFTWEKGRISSFAGVHRPEVCLPAAGFELQRKTEPVRWETTQGSTISFDTYVFEDRRGQPVFVFFGVWDIDHAGQNPDIAQNAYERVQYAFEGKRVGARQQLQYVMQGPVTEKQARRAFHQLLENAVVVN